MKSLPAPEGRHVGHSYTRNFIHLTFSTKGRRRAIPPEFQPRLWKYLAAIANERNIEVMAVGGVEDHVHMLLAIPASCALADFISKLKANLSKWMRSQNAWPGWQEGYGAFSVSASHVNTVCAYIRGQAEHHKKHTFEEEFLSLLKRYGVEYDPKFVLG
jgi:REP element-mobilizing transposase RayT